MLDPVKKDACYLRIATDAHKRAHRMLQILDLVGQPTIQNIGQEASEAVLLLAQHSHLAIMKKILRKYRSAYKKDARSIPFTYLPSLIDRIMILEHRQQYYGTQWMKSADDIPFLVHIKNFNYVEARRAEFGLGSIKKPTDLASKTNPHPLGVGNATKSDMRKLTESDYALYSKFYLESLTHRIKACMIEA